MSSVGDFVAAIKPFMDAIQQKKHNSGNINPNQITQPLEKNFRHKDPAFLEEYFRDQSMIDDDFVQGLLDYLQSKQVGKQVPLPIHRYAILRSRAKLEEDVMQSNLCVKLIEYDELGFFLTILSLVQNAEGFWKMLEAHTSVFSVLTHTNCMIAISRTLSRFRKIFKTATAAQVHTMIKFLLKVDKSRSHVGGLLMPNKVQHFLFWCATQLAAATEEEKNPNTVPYIEKITAKLEGQLEQKVRSLELCTVIKTLEADDLAGAIQDVPWETLGPFRFDVAATYVRAAVRTKKDSVVQQVLDVVQGVGIVAKLESSEEAGATSSSSHNHQIKRVEQMLEKWEAAKVAAETTANGDNEDDDDLPPSKHIRSK